MGNIGGMLFQDDRKRYILHTTYYVLCRKENGLDAVGAAMSGRIRGSPFISPHAPDVTKTSKSIRSTKSDVVWLYLADKSRQGRPVKPCSGSQGSRAKSGRGCWPSRDKAVWSCRGMVVWPSPVPSRWSHGEADEASPDRAGRAQSSIVWVCRV